MFLLIGSLWGWAEEASDPSKPNAMWSNPFTSSFSPDPWLTARFGFVPNNDSSNTYLSLSGGLAYRVLPNTFMHLNLYTGGSLLSLPSEDRNVWIPFLGGVEFGFSRSQKNVTYQLGLYASVPFVEEHVDRYQTYWLRLADTRSFFGLYYDVSWSFYSLAGHNRFFLGSSEESSFVFLCSMDITYPLYEDKVAVQISTGTLTQPNISLSLLWKPVQNVEITAGMLMRSPNADISIINREGVFSARYIFGR